MSNMASSSRAPTAVPSTSATPVPSSPPPSESFFSELDGTAPSVLETIGGDFQWDAGTSGRGLNLVSWKKGVEEGDEATDKRGFYAISTVLNHPTKKANPLRSTRKPLPPLPPAPPLPKPPPASHFDAYLKAVTPLYDTLQRSRAAADASPADVLTGAFDNQSPAPTDLPPLTSVPDLFFNKEFNLADQAIWSQVVEAGPSRTNVQNHLSSHLDTLERHLIHEITLRSTSFFSALSNLQDLHSESASCLQRISELQSGLREVGDKQARKGLTILDKMEDLRILRVTEQGMGDLKEAEEIMEVAKSLVEAGDWAGALGCVGDVVRWWDRHRPNEENEPPDPSFEDEEDDDDRPLPLSLLPSMSAMPLAISDLTTQIALQLESALQSYLLSTLSSAELDVPYDKERFRDHVVPIVEGLVRCGAGDAVEGVWREVVTLAVREGSRKHLPISQEEEGDEAHEMRGATLASALKSMDHSRYLLLATQMYSSILARLGLAQIIGPDLSSILTSSSEFPPLRIRSFIPSTEITEFDPPPPLRIDEADIIASACELGNLRASKILAVRGEQHAGLGINEFVELFKENWSFVLATEVLSGRMIASLRGVTTSQARTFLIAYHSQRLTKSAKLVEEEQWNQIDVTQSMQHNVNILIESSVSDPSECFIPPKQPITNGHTGGLSKTLDVEDQKFFVVKATAESIGLLKDYLGVVINLEVVVTDVMGRIIEFLKSFNSRTCQVVLGAGAMRSAGLKNITAKHLALASQSLSVIVALIPYIREFIRRHLSVKQAVMLTEFDKLKRDYQEHQNEIHAKLVAIMSDRLAVHVGSLREIDWEATPEKDSPRPYAELLVKETATLHKVLGKYLSPSTVESVMSEVLAAIVHRLSEEYSRIELKSDDAKKRLLQDAELITARLTPLSEAGKTVSSLEVLVKDKPVPRKNIIGNLLKRNKKDGNANAAGVQAGQDGEEEVYDDGDEDDQVTVPAESVDQVSEEAEGQLEPVIPVPDQKDPPSEEIAEAPRESSETESTTTSTAPTSIPELVEPLAKIEIPVETPSVPVDTSADPILPDIPPPTPVDPSPPPTPIAKPPPAPSDTPLSIITSPPPRSSLTSPPPHSGTPPSSSLLSLTSPPTHPDPRSISDQPASPSPSSTDFPSTLRSIRAPRVSLANRLKGVITRAGSVDRETEPMLSPPIPLTPTRGSVDGLRRSMEMDRPGSRGIEGLERGQNTSTPPPVPSKEAKGDETLESKGDKVEVPQTIEIVSPIPTRIAKGSALEVQPSTHLETEESDQVVQNGDAISVNSGGSLTGGETDQTDQVLDGGDVEAPAKLVEDPADSVEGDSEIGKQAEDVKVDEQDTHTEESVGGGEGDEASISTDASAI